MEEWFRRIGEVESKRLRRRSFNAERLVAQARAARDGQPSGAIPSICPGSVATRASMGAQGNQTMSDTVSQAMPTQPALIDGVNEDGHNRGYADYPETPWGRSTAFQSIFSNFFQYRVGHGEIALMLGTITTQPTSAACL